MRETNEQMARRLERVADDNAEWLQPHQAALRAGAAALRAQDTLREVELGVIEFHSERLNPGLCRRFYAVVDDLRASGAIVDLWLMDIATVLGEFGYQMRVFSTAKPEASAATSQPSPPEAD